MYADYMKRFFINKKKKNKNKKRRKLQPKNQNPNNKPPTKWTILTSIRDN